MLCCCIDVIVVARFAMLMPLVLVFSVVATVVVICVYVCVGVAGCCVTVVDVAIYIDKCIVVVCAIMIGVVGVIIVGVVYVVVVG